MGVCSLVNFIEKVFFEVNSVVSVLFNIGVGKKYIWFGIVWGYFCGGKLAGSIGKGYRGVVFFLGCWKY